MLGYSVLLILPLANYIQQNVDPKTLTTANQQYAMATIELVTGLAQGKQFKELTRSMSGKYPLLAQNPPWSGENLKKLKGAVGEIGSPQEVAAALGSSLKDMTLEDWKQQVLTLAGFLGQVGSRVTTSDIASLVRNACPQINTDYCMEKGKLALAFATEKGVVLGKQAMAVAADKGPQVLSAAWSMAANRGPQLWGALTNAYNQYGTGQEETANGPAQIDGRRQSNGRSVTTNGRQQGSVRGKARKA